MLQLIRTEFMLNLFLNSSLTREIVHYTDGINWCLCIKRLSMCVNMTYKLNIYMDVVCVYVCGSTFIMHF